MSEIQVKIQHQIEQNPVVLYMKGTKDFPACGFSARVVQILHDLGVSFTDVDILEDAELRQAIKDYSNWPTLPQLYINGEFIGGCDIVTELYKSGELKKQLQAAGLCPL